MSKIMLVGGAVRDKLLNIKPKDYDYIVIGSQPEEMLQNGFKCVGKHFPVFLHPISGDEYALARKERKSAHGYNGFEFNASPEVTIEEDLLRRDLTINAIAFNEETKEYIDPYNGKSDLENKILRHVSSAFAEDPLRVLRVARFFARYHHLGFTVASETMDIMRSIVESGELIHLTKERIWSEIRSALHSESPEKFFECLREIDALKVILPEVNALFGVPQPELHHPEIDSGVHTLMSLAVARTITCSPETLFGVLLHDLGKAITPTEELPRHIGHEDSGVPIVRNVCKRLKVPSSYTDFAVIFCKEHLRIHRSMEMKSSKLLALLKRLDARRKPERFIQFCIAAKSDACGRLGLENKPYPQFEYLIGAAEALNSVDLSQFDFRTEKGKQNAYKAKIDMLEVYKQKNI